MEIQNPFVNGTAAFQNFNSDVQDNSHLSVKELEAQVVSLTLKADDFLNSSDSQRNDADNKIKALIAIIKNKCITPENNALLESLKAINFTHQDGCTLIYGPSISAKVSAENGDISSEKSVLESVKSCVSEMMLVDITKHVFERFNGFNSPELTYIYSLFGIDSSNDLKLITNKDILRIKDRLILLNEYL